MEGYSEENYESLRERLIKLVCVWGEEQSGEALHAGEKLSEKERALAVKVEVEKPEQVRIMEVERLPSPEDSEVLKTAEESGFDFSNLQGLTLGYAVFILRGYKTERLMSHELRHVHQYEQSGSLREFLQEYLSQLLDYGYVDAPYEIDARNHESE